MKTKILLMVTILSMMLGISLNVSASGNDYVIVLKDEYKSNAQVLEYLEPLWKEAGIYILKEGFDPEIMTPYAESIEKDEPIDVVFEEPDPVLMTEPADPNFSRQWNHGIINVKASRDIENYGKGVRVAVIDSGCYNHPDLADNLLPGREYFTGSKTADVTDNVGHGTHVSGIIAASMNNIGICGVAPKAYIVPLKAFDTGATTTSAILAQAIRDAVDVYGCDVINMSFGMSSNVSSVRTAINYAAEKGVILVASSGNAENGETPDKISYPAYYDAVISVASLTSSGVRASYSYYNAGVTVSAPGSGIYSTYKNGGYTSMSGTSQAAPHVAGVAALALSANPDLTKEEFEQILISTCVDKGDEGRDDYYGYGVVNVEAMIEKIMEDVPLYISPMHQNGTTSCFHIRNNTDTPLVATNIFAEYDDGMLVNMTSTDINLKKGEGITIPVAFEYSKHFVWKSLDNIEPLENLKVQIQTALGEE